MASAYANVLQSYMIIISPSYLKCVLPVQVQNVGYLLYLVVVSHHLSLHFKQSVVPKFAFALLHQVYNLAAVLYLTIEGRLTQLALHCIPKEHYRVLVLRVNILFRSNPMLQALKVNVSHGSGAVARRNLRVFISFRSVQAQAAHFFSITLIRKNRSAPQ